MKIMNKISGKRERKKIRECGNSENRPIRYASSTFPFSFALRVSDVMCEGAFFSPFFLTAIFMCMFQSEKVCWFLLHNPKWNHANKECQFSQNNAHTARVQNCVKYRNCAVGKSKTASYVPKNLCFFFFQCVKRNSMAFSFCLLFCAFFFSFCCLFDFKLLSMCIILWIRRVTP